MTATTTPPDAPATAAAGGARPASTDGLAGVLGSVDHKVIGRLYVGVSLLFGVVWAVAGGLLGIDGIDGELGDTLLSGDTAGQVLTFHAVAGVFLLLLPLTLGIAMVIVPLQVGSPTIAFPRAAAASFWTWLMGSGLVVLAYAINGGPGGGRSDAVDLWAGAMILLLAALVVGSITVATTVIALRAPGMGLDRVPLFSWGMLTSSTLWVLSLPVLAASLLVIYLDHRYGQVFLGAGGVAVASRIGWVFGAPQILAFAAPALGFAVDAAATGARTRVAMRAVAQGAVGALSVLGFGAFAQAAVSSAADDQPVTAAMSFLAVPAVLAGLAVVGATVKAGRVRPTSGLVAAVAAVLALLLGSLLGAASSVRRLDLAGTRWEAGEAYLVLVAGLIGAVGALYHWGTKIVGRVLPEAAGRLAPVILLVGGVIAAGADAVSGVAGDGDEARTGIGALNVVSTLGIVVVLLGLLVAAAGLVGRRAGDVPDDPWDGGTLEWATASPPVAENFATLPMVTSAEPLLDEREGTRSGSTEESA